MAQNAELHGGDVHDDVTECHADHVVIVDGADVDAVQVGQGHHQILPAHGATVGVLPVILKYKYNVKILFFCVKCVFLFLIFEFIDNSYNIFGQDFMQSSQI